MQDGRVAQFSSQRWSSTNEDGRFLDQLLVPHLDAALPFAEMYIIAATGLPAPGSRYDGAFQYIFPGTGPGCRRRPRLRPMPRKRLPASSWRFPAMRMPRPPPPPAALRITGNPTWSAASQAASGDRDHIFAAGNYGDARCHQGFPGCRLVPGRGQWSGSGRADKGETAVAAGLCKGGTFRQKSVSRMDGVSPGLFCRLDHRLPGSGSFSDSGPARCVRPHPPRLTCEELSLSASEYTATVAIPISRQVRMILHSDLPPVRNQNFFKIHALSPHLTCLYKQQKCGLLVINCLVLRSIR
jgi:hypothetical protein